MGFLKYKFEIIGNYVKISDGVSGYSYYYLPVNTLILQKLDTNVFKINMMGDNVLTIIDWRDVLVPDYTLYPDIDAFLAALSAVTNVPIGGGGGGSTFASNIVVSLSGGKTVGKYTNGQTIPSMGKTAEQVFNLIAQESIAPTVNLSSPTTVQFNQTAISNVLNYSYTINTLGASVSTALLEFRRNNTGSWTTLSTSTVLTTFTHNMTDSAFNTQPFNYRYTVTDSAGASNVATFDITPQAYVAPSITFSAPATSISGIESNTVREFGNISSVLQGSTSRNSVNVPISSYQYQYSVNGGAFVNLGSSTALAAAGGSFTTTTHNDALLQGSNTITYKVIVTDSFTTTSSTYSISFKLIEFYGPSAVNPLTSAQVRALPSQRFIDAGTTFNLLTGTIQQIFSIELPGGKTLVSVFDATAGFFITGSFVLSTFNVNDAAGNPSSANVYTLTNAVPYSSSHTFNVTTS